jgi:TM2 domain-containing membrane protein YozV
MSMSYKSKTCAAFLALAFGWLGAHRFYLYGYKDRFGWAHIVGSVCGALGWQMLLASQGAAAAGWFLTVLGGAAWLAAFLAAIVYGLQADTQWDAHFNRVSGQCSRSGWGAVCVVVFAFAIGFGLLIMGLAIAFQTYFEARVVGYHA